MDLSALREDRVPGAMGVYELNEYIRSLLEQDRRLTNVCVRGEISNFVHHASGHLYFSLKDSAGQIKAVMFRSAAQNLPFEPRDGMCVLLTGSVSVYSKGGNYQLYARTMIPDGVGSLYLAYEQLKQKLSAEGLFDSAHKKPIKKYPSAIGVITSPTGAAVRDIIHIVSRRFPYASIILYPALVQGSGAPASLIRGLSYFENVQKVDTIIIGRGGGSIEDLWGFNDETLARAVYNCKTPVISAVGHEIDFTICDFVADLRAPTPSAAAELAVPDSRAILESLDVAFDRLAESVYAKIGILEKHLERFSSSRMIRDPLVAYKTHSDRLAVCRTRLKGAIEKSLTAKEHQLRLSIESANAYNPLAILSRGYGVIRKGEDTVRGVADLRAGDTVQIILSDGNATCEVKGTEYEKDV